MRNFGLFLLTFAVCAPLAQLSQAQAPRHELAFTLGRVKAQTRTGSGTPAFVADLGSGTALQANYGLRVAGGGVAALYIGGHLLASPQRKVTSIAGALTRDFASLYLTPHLTLKLAPGSRVSPWATFGGGYALYEQSTTTIAGAANPNKRHLGRGAWVWGGGVDVKLVRFLALRGEVRDFYTGNPGLGLQLNSDQHNVVAGGGFVLRF